MPAEYLPAVAAGHVPNAAELRPRHSHLADVDGLAAHGSNGRDLAFHFPDDKHIVVSSQDGLVMYLGHAMPKTGEMSYGLKPAASGRPVVGSVNLAALPIPPQFLEQLPPDVRQLLKAQHSTASLDLGAAARVELTAGYKNADDATAAGKAVNSNSPQSRLTERYKSRVLKAVRGGKRAREFEDCSAREGSADRPKGCRIPCVGISWCRHLA